MYYTKISRRLLFRGVRLLSGPLLVLFLLSGCGDLFSNDPDDEYRKIAWNALTEEQKQTVIIDLDDANVNRNDTYVLRDKEGPNKEVPAVSVRFNTKDDSLLGPIIVYIAPDTKEVLGQGLRF